MTSSESSPTRRRAPSFRELRSHPAVRNYMLFCLAALFLMVLCLADRGLDWWSLVPALIGCLTLLTHWSYGPPLVLASLAGLLGVPGARSRWGYAGWSRFETPTLMDLVLCIAVLAYVLGHSRLLSLTRSIFPAGSSRSRASVQRRSADLVHPWEMALLGFALPVWVGLAVLVWTWLMEGTPPLGMPRAMGRVLRLAWAVLAVLATTGIVSSYLRRLTATAEESLLFLQDQCWRQTRREQGHLARWLTWARLRRQRKKETA